MSTSAVTVVKNRLMDGRSVNVAKIYRHWDGGPESHGKDIALALAAAARTAPKVYVDGLGERHECSRLNNRNWAQTFLGYLCACDADLEFLGVEEQPPVCEYIYEVEGEYNDLGGKEPVSETEYLERIGVAVRKHCWLKDGRERFSYKARAADEYIRWCGIEPDHAADR